MPNPVKEPLDPMSHVREITVSTLQRDAGVMMLLSLMGGAAAQEAKARAAGIRLIMDRFPEIDWGTGAKMPKDGTEASPTIN